MFTVVSVSMEQIKKVNLNEQPGLFNQHEVFDPFETNNR